MNKILKTFLKVIVVLILILVAAYCLAGFFVLPMLIEKHLPDQAMKHLGYKVTIQKAQVNPLLLTAGVKGLDIKDKTGDQTLMSAGRVLAGLSPQSLLKLAPVISQIKIDAPDIRLVRYKDGRIHLPGQAMPEAVAEKSAQKNADTSPEPRKVPANKALEPKEKTLPPLILNHVGVTNGKIYLQDRVTDTEHRIDRFSLVLPHVSTLPAETEKEVIADLSFLLNGAPMEFHCVGTPFSGQPAVRVLIDTKDIDIAEYKPYLPMPDGLVLSKLGLNTDMELFYQHKTEGPVLELQGLVDLVSGELTDAAAVPLVSFTTLRLDILQSDCLSGEFNLGNVLLDSARFSLKRDADGRMVLPGSSSDPGEAESEPAGESDAPDPKSKSAARIKIHRLDVKNARIAFKDESLPEPFETIIEPFTAKVENFQAGETVSCEYTISLATPEQERLEASGSVSSHPLSLKGEIKAAGLKLNQYDPYLASVTDIRVGQGKAAFSTLLDMATVDGRTSVKADVSDFSLESLSLLSRAGDEKLAELPRLKITKASFDLGQHQVTTGDVVLEDAMVFLKRLADGGINLAMAAQSSGGGTQAAGTDAYTSAPEEKGAPWQISLPSLALSGCRINFTDQTTPEPVKIDLSDINITVNDVATQGEEPGRIIAKMKWNRDGNIDIKGSLLAAEEKADLDIVLDKIDIKSMQPYFSRAVNVMVTGGDFHAKGKFGYQGNAGRAPSVRFAGTSSVTGFVCLDKISAKEFFKAKSLYLGGLKVATAPVKVEADTISLTDFYSRITVFNDGRMNLSEAFKTSGKAQGKTGDKAESPEVKQESGGPQPDISIRSVTLQGGDIEFSDYFTQPNFKAVMKAIAGSVTGLSSDPKTRAKLHLKGIHGHSSPLEIIGSINPLAQKKFADIDVTFKDIELTRFTPYAAKYLGYKIDKGKLILDLEYLVDGNALKSENRARFDNFALGERVQSKDATSLPVGLAVSLLKDADGQINLDLPVSGRLDDPEFSVGRIIIKMIGNLILKVATSPFSIIGSMFGGEEDLEYIDFAYGTADLSPDARKKADKVAALLDTKPSVKLEIQGMYDKVKDAQSLRKSGFNDLIKAEKIKQLLAGGSSATTLEQVTVTEDEMPVYIYLAYAKADFPKPRDPGGAEKQVSVEEKKKLLMTHIPVSEDDLRQLSLRRSEAVKAYILSTAKVKKERIFLREPIENPASKKDSAGRVRFMLK